MRISDWSSDVCSSDLADAVVDRLDSEAPGVDLARRWKRKRVRTIIVVDPSGATCSARGRDVAPWPVGRCGAGLLLPPRPRTGGVDDRYAKRSEERRVGKERVSTGRARWSPAQ